MFSFHFPTHSPSNTHGTHTGEIDLNKCREIANREAIKGHKYVFDVCTQDRIYHLAAECIEDKQQWIGTLNKVLHGGQVVRQPAQTLASFPSLFLSGPGNKATRMCAKAFSQEAHFVCG